MRDQPGDTLRDPATRSLAERMADDITARSVMQYCDPQAQDTAPGKDPPKPDRDARDTIVPPGIPASFDFLL